MADSELKKLLVGPGAPFATQVQLVDAILKLEESPYPNRSALASFLSQVLSGKRVAPPELASAIMAAYAAMIEDADVARDPSEQLRLRALLTRDGGEVDALLARQARAHSVVIVTPEPLEIRGHPRARDFQAVMFDSLLGKEDTTYTFVMGADDIPAIRRQVEATCIELERRLNLKESGQANNSGSTKLKEMMEAHRYEIIAVGPEACAVPLVAFDPHQSGWCELFFWDWQPVAGVVEDHIERLSPALTFRWLHSYYRGFLRRPDAQGVRMYAASDFFHTDADAAPDGCQSGLE